MSNKEFGIIVTGDIEDIEEKLSSLVDDLDKLVDKVVEIGLDINDEGLDTLKSELSILDSETITVDINADDEASDIAKAVQELFNSLDGDVSTITLNANGAEAETTAQEVKSLLDELNGMTSTVTINAADNASDELDDIKKEIDELDGDTATVVVDADTEGASTSITDLTGAIATGITSLVGYDQAIKGLSFDKAVDQSIVWGNATEDNKNQIEDLLRSLSGAKFKLDDVSQAYAYLTRATGDWKAASEELPQILSYVKISGGDLETTVYNLSTVFEKYNMNADDATKFTGYLADMINQTKLNGNDFDRLLMIMSRDLAQVGFSAYDTAALIAAFDKSGISAQEMMRAARQGFSEFVNNFAEGSPKLQQVEEDLKKMGIASRDAQGNLRPVGDVLQEVMQKMGEYPTGPEKMRLANDLFGNSAGKVMSQVKYNYKDMENQALTSGSNTAEAINSVGKAHQQAGDQVENETQKLISRLGYWGAQILQWTSIILGGITTVILGLGAFGSSVGKVLDKVFDTEMFGAKMKGWQDTIRIRIGDLGSRVVDTIRGWSSWGDEAGKSAEGIGKAIEGKVDSPSVLSKIQKFGSDVLSRITGWHTWSDEAGNVVIDMFQQADGTWTAKEPTFISKVVDFGKSIPSKLSEAISGVGFKLPGLEGLGASIPEGLSSGLLKALPKLAGDLAIPLAAITMAVDGIYHYTDSVKEGPIGNMLAQWGLSLPSQLAVLDNILSPENILGTLIGHENADSVITYLDQTINAPIKNFLNDLPTQIMGILSGITKIDLLGLIFGGGSGDPNDFSLLWGFQTQISNFIAWLTTLPAQIMAAVGNLPGIMLAAFSGFTEWLANLPENIGRMIGDAIVLVLQGIYTILKFVIDLPGQVVSAINNLGAQITGTVNNIGPMIQNSWNNIIKIFNDFVTYLTKLPGEVYKYLVDLSNQVGTAISSIPGKVKDGINQIISQFNAFIDWLKGLPSEVYKWISKTFDDMVNYIGSIPDKARGALDDIIQKFKDFISWIESLPTQFYNAIVNAWNGFIKGLSDKFPQIQEWLQKIRDLFPHSPPKTGPLIDIMDWGSNMADAIQSGLDSSFPGLVSNFESKMQALKDIGTGLSADIGDLTSFGMSENTLNTVSNPTSDIKTEVSFGDIKVDVDKLDLSSDQNIDESVDTLFTKFMERIKSELGLELGQKGIKLFD